MSEAVEQAQAQQPVTTPAASEAVSDEAADFEAAKKILEGGAQGDKASEPKAEAKTGDQGKTEEPSSDAPKFKSTAEALAAASKEFQRARAAGTKLKEERANFEKERTQMQAHVSQAQRILDAAKADPIALVEQLAGRDWFEKAVVRFAKNGGKPTAEELAQRSSSEVDKLREELVEERKQRHMADYRRAAESYESEVRGIIAGEQYDLFRDSGAEDEVWKLVGQVAHKHGLHRDDGTADIAAIRTHLTPKQAVDTINEALVARFRKLQGTRGWQVLGGSTQETPQVSGTKQSAGKTLTNNALADRTLVAPDDDDDDPAVVMEKAKRLIRFNP